MAAEAQRAPSVRERTSFAARIADFWRRVEPGLAVDRDNSIENWAATAEGRAIGINYEGFGISLFLVFGRTPKPMVKPTLTAPRFPVPAGSLAASFRGQA